MEFKTLSARELDKHRGICPLEIGRFQVINDQAQELIGPLEIRKIFSQYSDGENIYTKSLDGSDFRGPLQVFEGVDGKLYMLQDEIYYSITKVLEKYM